MLLFFRSAEWLPLLQKADRHQRPRCGCAAIARGFGLAALSYDSPPSS
jgi:hypothetical protein